MTSLGPEVSPQPTDMQTEIHRLLISGNIRRAEREAAEHERSAKELRRDALEKRSIFGIEEISNERVVLRSPEGTWLVVTSEQQLPLEVFINDGDDEGWLSAIAPTPDNWADGENGPARYEARGLAMNPNGKVFAYYGEEGQYRLDITEAAVEIEVAGQ